MIKNTEVLTMDLQLFSEGGASGAPGASASGEGTQIAQTAETVLATPQNTTGDITDTEKHVPTPEERSAAFKEMIKGDYKDAFAAEIQKTVARRLKGTQDTVSKYNTLMPSLQVLAKKYGVDPTDAQALAGAIENDDSFYEQEAMERDMSVSELRYLRKTESENATLKQQLKAAQAKENADRLYVQWMSEAEEIQGIYPSFDLESEMQNEQFIQLLKSNIDMRTAYEVLHKDEIIPAAMQFTAQQVSKQMANKVIAGASRPNEGAASSGAPAVVKYDVSKMTPEQRRDINRRVANGEKISFT